LIYLIIFSCFFFLFFFSGKILDYHNSGDPAGEASEHDVTLEETLLAGNLRVRDEADQIPFFKNEMCCNSVIISA
jgi:hypothetical protein